LILTWTSLTQAVLIMIKEIQSKSGILPQPEELIAQEAADIIDKSLELEDKVIKSIELFPRQLEFKEASDTKFTCGHTICLYLGAYGAAKTTTLAYLTTLSCAQIPGLVVIVVRKTIRELWDSTQKVFLEEFFPLANINPGEDYVFRKKDNEIIFKNGSKIMFRSCDDPYKFRSINAGMVVMDEGDEIEERYFEALVNRIRQQNVPIRRFLIATNPPNVDHWLYKRFVTDVADGTNKNYTVIHTAIFDNPHLPKEYVDNTIAEMSPFPGKYKAFVLGDWGVSMLGNPVYLGEYVSEYHVAKEPLKWQEDLPLVRGWDFGLTPCVIIAQVTRENRVNFLHMWLPIKPIHLDPFADMVVKGCSRLFPSAFFIDIGDIAGKQISPEAGKSSVQILREKYGIKMNTRSMGLIASIEMVGSILSTFRNGKPVVQISPIREVSTLRDALEAGYCYPDHVTGNKKDAVPIKDGFYEHPADVFRYILYHIYHSNSLPGFRRRKKLTSEPTCNFNFKNRRKGYGTVK